MCREMTLLSSTLNAFIILFCFIHLSQDEEKDEQGGHFTHFGAYY